MYLQLLALFWNINIVAELSCSKPQDDYESQIEINADDLFYFDFVVDELPQDNQINFITIKAEKQQYMLMVIKQNQEFLFFIKDDNKQKLFQINRVQLGVFQQIVMKYEREYIRIQWHSDFQMIQENKFMTSHQKFKIINKQNFINQQSISNSLLDQFMTKCKEAININIQLYPQLEYLLSETFNNNFYKISFWVKQLNQNNEHMSIQIGDETDGKNIMIQIERQHGTFLYDESFIMQDVWGIKVWILFQFTYSYKSGIFKYQRDNYVKDIKISQNYQHQIRLYIRPHKNIIFTEALIQISSQFKSFLCAPGCLKCENNGYCLQCEEGYIYLNNFCECQQDFQFFFLPSECYIKLEYEILQLNRTRNNCPTFGGQPYPQCEDHRNNNFTYCLFATDIPLHSDQLERDFDYHHLQIQCQLLEGQYYINNKVNLKKNFSNIIFYQQQNRDVYLIGLTNKFYKACFNGLYYDQGCKRLMKYCRIQLYSNVCRQCLQKHFLLNGKCMRCPSKCEFCKIIHNQLQCMKFVQDYFLNFQRKCVQCQLQFCDQCYLYNGKVNTLERNFEIKQLSFPFLLGCSYCQRGTLLLLEQRVCKQVTFQDFLTVNFKNYENTQSVNEFLFQMIEHCQQQITQCQFCQLNQCLFCNENYILNVKNNLCLLNQNNLLLFNTQKNLQDYYLIYNLVTFLYYNYSYIDIIQQQQQYYIQDCQFNNFDGKLKNISCDKQIQYLTHQMGECNIQSLSSQNCQNYRYQINFNINLKGHYISNNFELEIKNSYINRIELIKQYQLHSNILNIFINKVTQQFYQYNANIPYHPIGYQIILQFNNSSIFDDGYMYFEESLSIIDSKFNVFKDFTMEFNSNSQGKLILANVTFTGQNNQSSLIFKIKSGEFEILNMTVQNFSIFLFIIQSDQLVIQNLNLTNLIIDDQNFDTHIILIRQNSTIINGFNIQNCMFTNINLFKIDSYIIYIQNVQIFKVYLIQTKLIILIAQYIESFSFKHILIKSIISNDSELFKFENLYTMETFQPLITDISISFSKFQNTYIFKTYLTDIITINFSNIILLKNFFKNSVLVHFSSSFITFVKIQMKNNYFDQNQFFIKFEILEIHFKQFYIFNNINYFGQLVDIQALENIFINQILYKNCSFLTTEDQPNLFRLINLKSQNQIYISNFYFIDINISISLIEAQSNFGQLDNIQIINITIIENQQFLISFINTNENEEKLILTKFYINNVKHQKLMQQFQHQIKQIIQIKFCILYLQDIFVTNIFAPQFRFITILDCDFFHIFNFHSQNISIQILISSVAFTNKLSHINCQKVYVQMCLFCFEPQNSLVLGLFLSNIRLIETSCQYKMIYIRFIYNVGAKIVSLNNITNRDISSETFIDIDTKYTTIKIQNILFTQSKLKQILTSLGHGNEFKIQYFIVSHVTFEFTDLFSFMIVSGESLFFLSNILFTKSNHISFFVASDQHLINNLMFLDSYILFIRLQLYAKQLNKIPRQIVINNIYLINNKHIESDMKVMALFQFANISTYINVLHIHNNTMFDDSTLLQIEGNFRLSQLSLTNNNCGQNCIQVEQQSKIIFQEIYIFQNINKNTSPLKFNNNSKVINFTFYSSKENQIAIQVNSKMIINQIKQNQLLYLPSGQKLIDYRIYDIVNNRLRRQVVNISIIKYNNSNDEIIIGRFSITVFEYDQINNNIESNLSKFQNIQVFQQSLNHFGLNEFMITFNPYQKNILMIEIQNLDDRQQKLTVFAKTQLCQIGEILTKNQCLVCKPELQIYSLKQKSNFCSIVDEQIISDHSQGAIKLRKGYWRPLAYKSIIEQCDIKIDKCHGGWHTGDNSCKIGYIGAICNACDIYNTRGNGYYLLEYNECKICGEFRYFQLLFKLILIIFILCFRLIFLLNSNIQNYKKLILQRLVNKRHFHVLAKYISDMPSLIFTILIGNLAILKFIIQDQIELPDILTIFTNPIIIEQNSFQCIQQFINLDYNYWIYYFKLVTPILTYNMFVFLMAMTIKRQNIIKTYFLFPIISLLLSQGPTLSVLFIKQVMYTSYSNIKYANFDYSIRFYSRAHQHNLQFIIIPIIILLNIILPFMLMNLIRKQASNILKDKFIQLANFILPFKSNYQELFNYYKNSFLLLLLSLNDKQLSFFNQTVIITIIMYISCKNEIYKIKHLSSIAIQSGMNLICILLSQFFLKQITISTPITILLILTILFILQQFNCYIQRLFHQNKLQIIELLQNQNLIIKCLGLNNHIQCLYYWKFLKQNYKLVIQQRHKTIKDDPSLNDIILQTVKTQMTNNSLIEIELMEL